MIGRDSAVRADGPYARRRAVQPPRLGLRLEKVDGWRILAYKDGARVRLMSRNGVVHTGRFGDLAAAVSKLSGRSLVLDGEVAIYDLMAFDLLYRDGRDLSARPLRDRRARLEDVVAASNLVFPVRRLAPDGLEAWSQVVERGYEGIVAKDDGSPYKGGPTRRCLKVKQKNWTVEEDRWRRRIFGEDRPAEDRTAGDYTGHVRWALPSGVTAAPRRAAPQTEQSSSGTYHCHSA